MVWINIPIGCCEQNKSRELRRSSSNNIETRLHPSYSGHFSRSFFQDPRKLVEPCIHTYMYMLEFLILEESVASSRVLPADEENRQGLL